MTIPECSISYCGMEDEEGLLPICPNGHYMHPSCIRSYLSSVFPHGMPCPQCRDGSLNILVVTAMPSPTAMMCTPFSALSAVVAMRTGAKEILAITKQ